MTIFIQVAAYRDTELGPTIRDCVAKAKHPKELRFGICLQDDLETDYGLDFNDSRIRVIHVPWQESQGVCWARHQAQTLYDGEDFVLQIDSHHRFAEHWDKLLLKDIERCESSKALLSTYPGSYDPDTEKRGIGAPSKILISRFDHKGSLKRYPLGYQAKDDLRPIPARFLAAGFLFGEGQLYEDLIYDPDMYFAGEEPSLTLRAFTHGYNIYHPQQQILWHEYVRDSKPKHWFDHMESDVENRQRHNKITELEAQDMTRFYALLSGEQHSNYRLGSNRTVHDYERFAGLDFTNKVVHQKTRLGIDPVNQSEEDWQSANQLAIAEKERLKPWFTQIDLSACEAELAKAKLGIVAYFDRDQQMIDRVTINNRTSIENGLLKHELNASAPPDHWVLTGFTHSNSWEQIRSAPIYDYRLLA